MDSRVRELGRRAAETGDTDDEARWLGERERVGDLSPAYLRIAALLSHPAARVVVPDAPTAPPPLMSVATLNKGKPGRRGRGALHGLRTRVDRHGVAYCQGTCCGRAISLANVFMAPEQGVPTCLSCLRSDQWRLALVAALGELVAGVADLDGPTGFRAGVMAVEHVMAAADDPDPTLVRHFAAYALWGSGSVGGDPPRGRIDYASGEVDVTLDVPFWLTRPPTLIPTEPNAWDPNGIYDEGPHAWLYGLGTAALDLHAQRPCLSRTLSDLMRPVAAWCLGTEDGRKLVIELIEHIQNTIIPFVIAGEDPLAAVAVHYREVAYRAANP